MGIRDRPNRAAGAGLLAFVAFAAGLAETGAFPVAEALLAGAALRKDSVIYSSSPPAIAGFASNRP